MTHSGKIGRLPLAVRDELNRRIEDGVPGVELIEWLNSLPEVQQVLEAQFEGRGINHPNLTAWINGGYEQWRMERDLVVQVRERTRVAMELKAVTGELVCDDLATVMAARYAQELDQWDGKVTQAFQRKMRMWQRLIHDVSLLRRGEHSANRSVHSEARHEWRIRQTEEGIVEYFKRWLSDPTVCAWLAETTGKEREERAEKLFRFETDADENSNCPGAVIGI